MGTRTVPAEMYCICDRCQTEVSVSQQVVPPFGWGTIRADIPRRGALGNVLDYQSVSVIICERCTVELVKFAAIFDVNAKEQ